MSTLQPRHPVDNQSASGHAGIGQRHNPLNAQTKGPLQLGVKAD